MNIVISGINLTGTALSLPFITTNIYDSYYI